MVSRNVKFTLFVVSGLNVKSTVFHCNPPQHAFTNDHDVKFTCGSVFIFLSVFLVVLFTRSMLNEIQGSGLLLLLLLSSGFLIL